MGLKVQSLAEAVEESVREAGIEPSSPSKGSRCKLADARPMSTGIRIVLLCTTVFVVMFASWYQEHVSRNAHVAKESILVTQTGAHVLLGMIFVSFQSGWTGLRSCIDHSRYILFAPAGMAYLACDFMTFIAVRGLGAAQFFLLSQLRIAVSAVLLRLWKGVHQSLLEWLALLQLSVGLLVLVMMQHPASSPSKTEATHEEYSAALVALVGILASAAFAAVYQEIQMKAHKGDSILVQMHQMNVFQLIAAVCFYARCVHEGSLGLNIFAGWDLRIVGFWLLCVGRGLLGSLLIKAFDTVVKGLGDVAAMIGVFVLKIVVDRQPVDAPVAGLQAVLLLSVLCYFIGRQMAAELATAKSKTAQDVNATPAEAQSASPTAGTYSEKRRRGIGWLRMRQSVAVQDLPFAV